MVVILCLLTVHFVADFVCQSNSIATRKSKDWSALLSHVLVYTAWLFLFGPWYALANGVLHFATDAVTSRISAYYWQANRRHAFFVTIGADQLIHAYTLILTAHAFSLLTVF